MKRPIASTLILLGLLFVPLSASATQIRAFVADFTVSSPDGGELRSTLKRLLVSRLSGDGIATVEAAGEADVIVSASYTQLGKVFSLDAVARTVAGRPLATAFEQGDGLDALIPAVGKLSAKLRGEIERRYSQITPPTRDSFPPVTEKSAPPPSTMVKPLPTLPMTEKVPAGDIVRPEKDLAWTSQRLEGAKKSLAPAGPKEFFVVDGSSLALYRQNATLTLVAKTQLPLRYRILAVDSVGSLAFVSIMDGDAPASRVYAVANGVLKLEAEGLPYLFRALALNGESKRLYAQEMGRTDDYYGDVYEASFREGRIKLASPIKMPRHANIFNFNIFRDRAGKQYLTAFSDSGYLLVYSDKGEELWRSNDKFGGTETSFLRSDSENARITGVPYRSRFIDQRIVVTEQGEIIVPQNSGFFVVGNARSYSKSSVFSFAWNGSSLEERWRTKLSQNYLADFSYLPDSKELVLLEVVQKEGVFGSGASVVKVIRAE